ncbi:hypothetical protein [Methylobacterium sp. J-076]|uniref:hypothetical protein n=1 Tax=Methylobacterium sp. J-076 TaxID=2836655 RepID=UPI001FB91589|nr:hypothetical protein [Methylobacterium sp. J-076]MCJ2015529.1 hypothetical protein [Methylobacterium sp. J-076]
MSDRTPATEKGTADRIEADDGGYWVRLVTKQALRREGGCMQNCLARGHYADTAGEEDLVSTEVWSLRKAAGLSYMDISVNVQRDDIFAGNAEGPKNSQPSGWSCRQLRHLVAAFRDVGATLRLHEGTALTGEDGRTWRPDKALQVVKDANAARLNLEGAISRIRVTGGGRLDMIDAMAAGMRSSLIHGVDVDGGETVLTLRISGPVDATLVANGDHTYALYLEGRDHPPSYPVVIPMGDFGMYDDPFLVQVRLPPVAMGMRRRYIRAAPARTRDDVVREIEQAETLIASGRGWAASAVGIGSLQSLYRELGELDGRPPRGPGTFVMLGTRAVKDEICRSMTSDGSRLGLHREELDAASEIRSGIEHDTGGPPAIHTISPPLG